MHRTWSRIKASIYRLASPRRWLLAKANARRIARHRNLQFVTESLEPRCLLTSSLLPLGNLPLAFEANEGQFDSQVNYLARGSGYTVFLTPGETIMSLRLPEVTTDAVNSGDESETPDTTDPIQLRVQLVGATGGTTASGLSPLASKTNYFVGADSAKWQTDVDHFGQVKYAGVYPGIDQVFHGNEGNLQYDFVIAPGALPEAIGLNFAGADAISLGEDGSLLIEVGGQTVVQKAPVIYQEINGVRQSISGHYVISGQTEAGFEIGPYDMTRVLTIDPTLTFSTYIGGTGTDQGFGIARDGDGNIYLAGLTTSVATATFGTTTIPGTTRSGNDVFVTKLNSTGTAVLWSAVLGGSGDDRAYGIAVRGNEAYLTGVTSSADFPLMMNGVAGTAIQSTFGNGGGGTWDAFVTKLTAGGNALSYSTYLGGSGNENASPIILSGGAIAVDGSGNAWVTGMTTSTNFTTTPTAFQPNHANDGGNRDAFVTRINAAGTQIDYSSYFGGTSDDRGQGIAVDGANKAYLTGATFSGTSSVGGTNFPVTSGPLQSSNRGSWEAYAAKIDPLNQTVTVSGTSGTFTLTFNGAQTSPLAFNASATSVQTALSSLSTISGVGGSVTVTSSGTVYTIAFGGAFANTVQSPLVAAGSGGTTATASGIGSLAYSTLLGGTYDDFGQAIAVDSTGQAYITGFASSASLDFPVVNALQWAGSGSYDAFITKLNTTGTGAIYSTYWGGLGDDRGLGIAVDAAGNAHVTGMTSSVAFPLSNPVATQYAGGTWDAFAVKISSTGTAPFYSTYLGGSGDDRGQGIVLDDAGGAIIGGLTVSMTLGTTPGVVQPANAGGTDAFVIQLTDTGNHMPTLPELGTVAVNQGSILNLSFAARDPDPGTTLTYSIDALPGGASFSTSTGKFSWTAPQQGALHHTATITVSDGTSTDTTTVTIVVNGSAAAGVEPASPSTAPGSSGTFTAGTAFSNFVAETSNPLGPFQGLGVHYLGTATGGSTETLAGARLIYRHQIDYGQPVSLSGVTVGGAAFAGSTAVLRLLAADGTTVLGTLPMSGGNAYRTFTLNLVAPVSGTKFFVDEFDTSSTWRYRDRIEVHAVNLSNPPPTLTPAPTAAGNGLHFDGVNDWVAIPDRGPQIVGGQPVDALHASRELTIAGWFKLDDLSNEWNVPYYKGNWPNCSETGCSQREYAMFINEEGSIQATATSVANVGITQSSVYVGPGTIEAGKWYNFAAVVSSDDNFFKLYLNGDLIGTTYFDSSGIRDTDGPLRFGDADHLLRGSIDNYSLWHKALSQGEVRELMHTTPALNAPGLMGYWPLDEGGTATIFADATANDNDGYLQGVLPGWPGALGGVEASNTAAQFDGGQIAMTIPQLNTTSGTTNTVSFWMNWDGTGTIMPIGFSSYDLWLSGGSFGFNTGSGDIYGISSTGLNDHWVQVVAVFPNNASAINPGSPLSEFKLYLDGVQQTLTQRIGTTSTTRIVTTDARISGWPTDGNYHFRGGLDEVAFFNRTLTPAEASAQYNARNSGYSAATLGQVPVAYYRLGGTGATFLSDSTANANHGTIASSPNSPVWETSTAPLYPAAPSPVLVTVTNTADNGPGSLRQVLTMVNALPVAVPVSILFNIPNSDPNFVDTDSLLAGGDPEADVFVIQPLTPLPALIHSQVSIDGFTQTTFGGQTNTFGPEIVLDGQGINGGPGLAVNRSNTTIAGLNIQRFKGEGILVTTADDNWIYGNYIGTDATGTLARGNTQNGINIVTSARNRIGTDGSNDPDNPQERNLISGNGATIGGNGIALNGSRNLGTLSDVVRMISGDLPSLMYVGTISQADIIDGSSASSASWAANFPAPGGGGDDFAIRGLGKLKVNAPGPQAFSFALANDDGGRLRIDLNDDGDFDDAGEEIVVRENANAFVVNYASVTLDGGLHNGEYDFEWIGFDQGGAGGFELSVAVGAGTTTTVNAANGWKVVGDHIPHSEINLLGSIAVTTYYTAANHVVAGNYIGTDRTGALAIGNTTDGVAITGGSRGNRVGTDGNGIADVGPSGDLLEGNLLSGNGLRGLSISGAGTHANVVAGNYIGTNAAGNTANANVNNGIILSAGAKFTRIGTDGSPDNFNLNERNIVSGNTSGGIRVTGTGTDFTVIAGNYVGTTADGLSAMPNGDTGGVRVDTGAQFTRVGTNGDGINDVTPTGGLLEGNLLSGNLNRGIQIDGAGTDYNVVAGNYIGTNRDGTAAIPNASITLGNGVQISAGTQFNRVGTDGSNDAFNVNERNVIGGNARSGVFLTSAGTSGNVVAGNFIGTTADGLGALENGLHGVEVTASAANNRIGTNADGVADGVERNVISANTGNGIHLTGASTVGTVIAGNYVGTDATGGQSLGGMGSGISLGTSATFTQVGTNADGQNDAAEANLIAGNGADGIFVTDAATINNVISGNQIGSGSAPNLQSGVQIVNGATTNFIGGVGLAPSPTQSILLSVDPKATYLRTSNDPLAKSSLVVNLLAQLNVVPGDRILIERLGNFSSGTGTTDTSRALNGVFSASSVLDPDSSLISRIPGAIDTGTDTTSPVTFSGSLATDIPQDFAINSLLIQVPVAATHLFLAVPDSAYGDNSDPNSDFTVRITPYRLVSGATAGNTIVGNAAAGITMNSTGTLTLGENAGLSDSILHNAGNLTLTTNASAGTAPITVSSTTGGGLNGTRITIGGGITVSNALSLPSNTTGDIRSIIFVTGGSNTWSGPITLNGSGIINIATTTGNTANLNLGGGLFGPAFTGTLFAARDSVNFTTTISGPINLPSGSVSVTNNANVVVTSTGNILAAYRPVSGTVRLGGDGVLPDTVNILMGQASSTGAFDLAGFDQQIDTLTVNSGAPAAQQFVRNSSTTSNSVLTFGGGASTFAGIIQNAVAAGPTTLGLTVVSGALTLTGANTYTGATNINGGSLLIDGSLASAVSVNGGGSLGGSGTVSTVNVNAGGTLAPGNSPGSLTTGNLALSIGGTLSVELNGLTVGTQYDRVNVTGTVNLSGATLGITRGFAPLIADSFTIIANDGADSVVGTFLGLAEGATDISTGVPLRITYHGGDGNDVVLTRVAQGYFVVTDPADSGSGTLRQAILNANAFTGLDRIEFAIAGGGVRTIAPVLVLPDISEAVLLDGTTQPGYVNSPLIELRGNLAGSGASGLSITGAGSTIRGLAITEFDGSDILVSGSATAGSLTLDQLAVVGVTISGDFSGSLYAQSPGLLNPLTITGTMTEGSLISAVSISHLTAATVAGTITASDVFSEFYIETITATGVVTASTISDADPDVDVITLSGILESTGPNTTEGVDIGTVTGTGEVLMQNGTDITIGIVEVGGEVNATGTIDGFEVNELAGTMVADELANGTVETLSGVLESTGPNTTDGVDIGTVTGSGEVLMQNGTDITIGIVEVGGEVNATGTIDGFEVNELAGTMVADELANGTVETLSGVLESTGPNTTDGVDIGTVTGSGEVLMQNGTDITIGIVEVGGEVNATGTIDGFEVNELAGTMVADELANGTVETLSGVLESTGPNTTDGVDIGTVTGSGEVLMQNGTDISIGIVELGGEVNATGTIDGFEVNELAGTMVADELANGTVETLSGVLESTGPNTTDGVDIGTVTGSGEVLMQNGTDITIGIVEVGGEVNATGTIDGFEVNELAGTMVADELANGTVETLSGVLESTGPNTTDGVDIGTVTGTGEVLMQNGTDITIGIVEVGGEVNATGTIDGFEVHELAGTMVADELANGTVETLSGVLESTGPNTTDGVDIGTVTGSGEVLMQNGTDITIGIVEVGGEVNATGTIDGFEVNELAGTMVADELANGTVETLSGVLESTGPNTTDGVDIGTVTGTGEVLMQNGTDITIGIVEVGGEVNATGTIDGFEVNELAGTMVADELANGTVETLSGVLESTGPNTTDGVDIGTVTGSGEVLMQNGTDITIGIVEVGGEVNATGTIDGFEVNELAGTMVADELANGTVETLSGVLESTGPNTTDGVDIGTVTGSGEVLMQNGTDITIGIVEVGGEVNATGTIDGFEVNELAGTMVADELANGTVETLSGVLESTGPNTTDGVDIGTVTGSGEVLMQNGTDITIGIVEVGGEVNATGTIDGFEVNELAGTMVADELANGTVETLSGVLESTGPNTTDGVDIGTVTGSGEVLMQNGKDIAINVVEQGGNVVATNAIDSLSIAEIKAGGTIEAASMSNVDVGILSGSFTVVDPIDVGRFATIARGAQDNFTIKGEVGPTNEDTLLAGTLFPGTVFTLLHFDSLSAFGAAVSINTSGQFTYDPRVALNRLGQGEKALDTFTLTTRQGANPEQTTTVTVRATGLNDQPVALNDTLTVNANQSLVNSAPGLLANDSDPDTDDVLLIDQVNGSASNVGTVVPLTFPAYVIVSSNGSYIYNPNGRYDSLPAGAVASDSFSYRISDGFGGFAAASVSITVSGVNEAPVLAAGSTPFSSINEDQVNNNGNDVVSLLGARISDVDSGAVKGIAVVATHRGNGAWEYSIDSGATWAPVGSVSSAQALLLRDSDRLRFVPDTKNGTTASVTYQAWDQTGATANQQGQKVNATLTGGTTSFSNASNLSSITVQSINDLPVAVNDAVEAMEAGGVTNASAGTNPIGNVLTNDTDVDFGDSRTVASGSVGTRNGAYGTLVLNADGSFSYAVTNDLAAVQALRGTAFTLSEAFNYTLQDSASTTAAGQLIITIRGANDTPTISSVSQIITVTEGQVATGTGAFGDVDGGDIVELTASVGTVVTDENGGWSWSFVTSDGPIQSQNVTITARDLAGAAATASISLIVSNGTPTASIQGAPLTSPEGILVSLTSQVSDPSPVDSFSYAWSVLKNGLAYAQGTSSSFSVMPNDNGTYLVSLTVTDDDGGVGTDTKTIVVNNIAPQNVNAGTDVTTAEGAVVLLSGSFSDPGSADTHNILWDFGDGATAAGTLAPTHSFADNGIYTVTLTVTDDDGGSASDTLTVTVSNAAPVVHAGANQTVSEGQVVSFAGSFNDAGSADTHTINWSFGDGAIAGGSLSPTHTYADDGSYTVTLTVVDDDGSSTSSTLTVTVTNANPVVNAGTDLTTSEGALVSFAGSFTDAGSADTHTLLWNFGDGGTATGTKFPTHAYANDGSYTVTLTVTDDNGGTSSDTLTVTVNNVAPTVFLNGPTSADEGQTRHYTFTTSDPGADTFSVVEVTDGSVGTVSNLTFNTATGAGSFDVTFSDGPATSNVRVQVKDPANAASNVAMLGVAVANVAPVVTILGAPGNYVLSYPAFSLTSNVTDPGAPSDPLTYAWSVSGSATYSSAITPDFLHFNSLGTYVVTLTVTDDDGGTGTDSRTIVVTNAPITTATISGAPASVTEATPLNLTGYADGTVSVTLTWSVTKVGLPSSYAAGNGTNFSFTPNDNGTYQVTLTAAGDSGSAQDTRTIVVTNVAPTASIQGALLTSPEGILVSLTSQVSDPSPVDSFSYAWSVLKNGVAYAQSTSSSFSVMPNDNGTYLVSLTVTDDDGGVGTDSKTIVVNNIAPQNVNAGTDVTTAEGAVVLLSGSFSDPGSADIHGILWDFGDGSTAAGTLAPTHSFADNGTYTVTLTVTDDDGGTASDTLTVTVSNAAPVVNAGANQAVSEGQLVSFVGNFTDAGSADTHTISWSFGDGAIAGGSLSPTHTYADDGSYTVTLTVVDDDGSSTSSTLTVAVTNANPVVNAGTDLTTSEGALVSFAGSFTDAGSADTHTLLWNFGDGGTATGTKFPTHAYANDGSYTVTLTVTDDNGGTSSDTLTVTVNNVAPTVFLNGPTSADEGQTRHYTFTTSDPGADTFSVVEVTGGLVGTVSNLTFNTATGAGSFDVTFSDGPATSNVRVQVKDPANAASNVATLGVAVANVAPVVNAGADQTANEGSTVNFTASHTNAGNADTHTITWDFGDGGTASGTLAPSHAYANEGSYLVTLTVTDDDGGTSSDTLTVVVSNVGPTVLLIGSASAYEGQTKHYTFTTSDPGADTFSVADVTGGSSGGVSNVVFNAATGAGSFDVTFHDGPAASDVRVHIKDSAGVSSNIAELSVVVANLAPQVNAGVDLIADEGTLVNFAGDLIDAASADTHTLIWDFGDGGSAAGTKVPTHTYANNGSYTVTLTVTDDDGGTSSDTLTVTVNNVAPSVTVDAPVEVLEDTPILVSSHITDPGSGDPVHYAWAVKKGTATYLTSSAAALSFTPATSGIYDVFLTVTDDVQSTTVSKSILVTNVAPTVFIEGNPAVSIEGAPIALNADISQAVDQSLTYHWSVTRNNVPYPLPAGTITTGSAFTFTPNDNGNYVVTLTSTDTEGGVGIDQETITVLNAAPLLTLTPPSITAGVNATFNLGSFTDAGKADTHTAIIDWGDGTTSAATVSEIIGNGAGSLSGTHNYAVSGFYTITVVLADDDGMSHAQSTSVVAAGVRLNGTTLEVLGTGDRDIVLVHKLFGTVYVHTLLGLSSQANDDDDCGEGYDESINLLAILLLYKRYQFSANSVQSILIRTYGGNDHVYVSNLTISQPATIDGGDGKDWLHGGAGNDTITDILGNNTIFTGGGTNIVTTGPGNDVIWGGSGNDTIQAGDGSNSVSAGGGDDTITTGSGPDKIWGGDGNDSILAGAGANEVRGEKGNDTVVTGNGADKIWGGEGNDNITGGDGNNQIWGEAGDDTIATGLDADTIDGGSGADWVRASAGNDVVDGGDGNDVLLGGDGNDSLRGGNQLDLIIGGTGADTLLGNADQDILIAGTTAYDGNDLALTAIMLEWTSGRTYQQRIYNLSFGTAATGLDSSKYSSRANQGYYLIGNDGSNQTVFNDNDKDTLTGNAGTDWFYANLTNDNGGVLDTITDAESSEKKSDSDF